ncbi:MAG: hypothetical protein E7621_07270 [Ruminococcaceae bacterium]|nr:hypothetical protein [Oscillospiraceae bacterium]
MNKKLSVVALLIQIVSVFLLYVDGIFVWYVHNYESNISANEYSFNWLINTQFDKSIFVFLTVFLILLNVAVEIITLFKEKNFLQNKYMLALPIITLVLFVALCMWGDSYSNTFTTEWGEVRHASAGLGLLYYVELVLLGTNILIECLKHFVYNNKTKNDANNDI